MTVYLVSTGEYENYGVIFVASSVEAAIQHLKTKYYGPPYLVEWSEVKHRTWTAFDGEQLEEWNLFGKSAAVAGYSCAHEAHFDIRAEEVH